MKDKHNGGFSLVEVLVSMVILAAIVVPTCTGLVLSYRMNAKTEELTQAQLAVSSAVETLMAEGITDDFLTSLTREGEEGAYYYVSTEYPDIVFELEDKGSYFTVTVMDKEDQVSFETAVRGKNSQKTLEGVTGG